MFRTKFLISYFVLISLILIGIFQYIYQPKIEIVSVFEDEASLELNIKINKKLNSLEFNSEEIIENILFFDIRGNIIKKVKPASNTISLNGFRKQDISISFISNDKMSIKSILY